MIPLRFVGQVGGAAVFALADGTQVTVPVVVGVKRAGTSSYFEVSFPEMDRWWLETLDGPFHAWPHHSVTTGPTEAEALAVWFERLRARPAVQFEGDGRTLAGLSGRSRA